jgi:hypothetical protein
MTLRRNDIITYPDDGGPWLPYGRISRYLGDGRWEAIYCGGHVLSVSPDEVKVVTDYKGYEDHRTGRFIRMLSLRNLKQLASGYHPEVWKKNRKNDQI